MLHHKIISFLINRNWTVAFTGSKLTEYSPPADLSLPQNFTISIPNRLDFIDFLPFTNNIFEVLSTIYDYSVDDLELIIQKEQTIFSIRIYDEKTKSGRISLNRFDIVLDKLKAILLDSASFVINRNSILNKIPPEATRYLNLCEFIETKKGSFVAKIKLPNYELIKEGELFERDQVFSYQINDKIGEVLSFVNDDLFTQDEIWEITDDFLIEYEEKINIKVLKDIETFYLNTEITNIDFTFSNILESKKIESQNITRAKINKLTEFIDLVGESLIETIELNFRGQIISLKSKDPDGGSNEIKLGGIYDNQQVVATAKLDSASYRNAIEGHKLKQFINISGLAKRTKTKINFLRIHSFEIEP